MVTAKMAAIARKKDFKIIPKNSIPIISVAIKKKVTTRSGAIRTNKCFRFAIRILSKGKLRAGEMSYALCLFFLAYTSPFLMGDNQFSLIL